MNYFTSVFWNTMKLLKSNSALNLQFGKAPKDVLLSGDRKQSAEKYV